MGAKDITEKALIWYNDVFADIVNNLLFDGEQVVYEGDLHDTETHQEYKSKGVRDQERDNCKLWIRNDEGVKIHFAYFGIENQTEADNDLPFRVIGYDGAAYRDQIYYYKDSNGRRRLSKDRLPVITLVLYMGYKKHWDKARTLYEGFTIKVPEKLRCRIPDYSSNIFEIAYLTDKQVAGFKSDFWVVADYFTQMRKTGTYIPSRYEFTHVREVLNMMEVFTGDKRFTQNVDRFENSKEGVTMCAVLDEIENRGIQKGMHKGMQRGMQEATALINYLWENGRGEDAKKAAADPAYYMVLEREYEDIQK